MTRVKKGVNAIKNRRNMLKRTKGFRNGRSTKERQANEAWVHAGTYAFAHRKDKKADFRKLWQIQISYAVKPHTLSYSKFIDKLKKKNIELDRKVMATLIEQKPETFARLLAQVK